MGGKVHHHNHLIDGSRSRGNYIGPANFKCNTNNRIFTFVVTVFAHGNFNYDYEHVLEGLGQCHVDCKLDPTAQSENHMISVKWGDVHMVPSCCIKTKETNKQSEQQTQLKSENELAEKELANESKRLKRTRIKGKNREWKEKSTVKKTTRKSKKRDASILSSNRDAQY